MRVVEETIKKKILRLLEELPDPDIDEKNNYQETKEWLKKYGWKRSNEHEMPNMQATD